MFSSATKSAAQGGSYNLTKSLRFRKSATAYLSRTPASASNLKTWTWSAWIKRGTLGSFCDIFSTGPSATNAHHIYFYSSDQIGFEYYNVTYDYYVASTSVYRDPAAWYHVVAVWDTTQATASNRMKLYVNNVLINDIGSTSYPTQNYDGYVNTTNTHRFGTNNTAASNYFDGYITEVNFIDGQALTPSSFGSTNATTGVWQPAKYTGTYGTNGFYLPFTNTTSTTTLGYDSSGNSNNWTTNNISLTAGNTYDSMTDVPTLTSATVANYAILNPLDKGIDATTANGNLTFTSSSIYWQSIRSSFGVSSGKWYWELNLSANTSARVGITTAATSMNQNYIGPGATDYCYIADSGNKQNNGTASAYGAAFGSGDIVGVAFDADAGSLTFYKNGTSQGVAYSGITSGQYFPAFSIYNLSGISVNANFGQRPFSYTPPTGYKALNTYNLPDSTIVAGNKYMDATTYTGNATTQTITNAGSFKPDFVWTKSRSGTDWNALMDSVRGTGKALFSNATDAEYANGLTSFNSNGFTANGWGATNGSNNYVGWQWQAGQGSTSSNTNGSITSTVSVSTTAGFSIVKWTANGSAGATIGHGLGVTPSLIILKDRTAVQSWIVYHSSLGNTQYIVLNSTGAVQTSAGAWNNTSPTSSVFTVGGGAAVNTNGDNMLAYCWTPIAGFSAFGSYAGNGSSDGTFVYTGFRPKYILVKASNGAYDWIVEDTSVNSYNLSQSKLSPNTSNAEVTTSSIGMDILSNGFKFRGTDAATNASGLNYIYAAFAENPFKNALAR